MRDFLDLPNYNERRCAKLAHTELHATSRPLCSEFKFSSSSDLILIFEDAVMKVVCKDIHVVHCTGDLEQLQTHHQVRHVQVHHAMAWNRTADQVRG